MIFHESIAIHQDSSDKTELNFIIFIVNKMKNLLQTNTINNVETAILKNSSKYRLIQQNWHEIICNKI